MVFLALKADKRSKDVPLRQVIKVPSQRSKLFFNPEILKDESLGQLESKNHKKRAGQRRKFETRYMRSLHWSYAKTSKIGVLT